MNTEIRDILGKIDDALLELSNAHAKGAYKWFDFGTALRLLSDKMIEQGSNKYYEMKATQVMSVLNDLFNTIVECMSYRCLSFNSQTNVVEMEYHTYNSITHETKQEIVKTNAGELRDFFLKPSHPPKSNTSISNAKEVDNLLTSTMRPSFVYRIIDKILSIIVLKNRFSKSVEVRNSITSETMREITETDAGELRDSYLNQRYPEKSCTNIHETRKIDYLLRDCKMDYSVFGTDLSDEMKQLECFAARIRLEPILLTPQNTFSFGHIPADNKNHISFEGYIKQLKAERALDVVQQDDTWIDETIKTLISEKIIMDNSEKHMRDLLTKGKSNIVQINKRRLADYIKIIHPLWEAGKIPKKHYSSLYNLIVRCVQQDGKKIPKTTISSALHGGDWR